MLGLGRPRLRARPSLLDLISRREEQPTPAPPTTTAVAEAHSSLAPSPPELPPLPDSPTSSSSINYTTPVSTPSTQTSSTMAPAQDESHAHGSVFSVSGPVVVAEHMIGCAMYELVSPPSIPTREARLSSALEALAVLIAFTPLVPCW